MADFPTIPKRPSDTGSLLVSRVDLTGIDKAALDAAIRKLAQNNLTEKTDFKSPAPQAVQIVAQSSAASAPPPTGTPSQMAMTLTWGDLTKVRGQERTDILNAAKALAQQNPITDPNDPLLRTNGMSLSVVDHLRVSQFNGPTPTAPADGTPLDSAKVLSFNQVKALGSVKHDEAQKIFKAGSEYADQHPLDPKNQADQALLNQAQQGRSGDLSVVDHDRVDRYLHPVAASNSPDDIAKVLTFNQVKALQEVKPNEGTQVLNAGESYAAAHPLDLNNADDAALLERAMRLLRSGTPGTLSVTDFYRVKPYLQRALKP